MKKTISILLILIIGACGKIDFHKELDAYNSTFENTIESIEFELNKIYYAFERDTDSIMGNPKRTMPWFEKALVLKSMSDSIIDLSESIQGGPINDKQDEAANPFHKVNQLKDYTVSLVE
ncbi:MAG: hypothetical protein HC831_25870, partial [Chloroflexia bacterium]|nr:hypothetical protein [Chloroflexia bacterium]